MKQVHYTVKLETLIKSFYNSGDTKPQQPADEKGVEDFGLEPATLTSAEDL